MVDRKFSRASSVSKLEDFNNWLGEVRPLFKEIYVIGGNHDEVLDKMDNVEIKKVLSNGKYLLNEGFEYKGLKIFATPLSEKSYHGDSKNTTFQSIDFMSSTVRTCRNYNKNKCGESGIDILLTHGLCKDLVNELKPKLHLYGHHHSSYGVNISSDEVLSICATIMDRRYKIRNPPIVVDIPLPMKWLAMEVSNDSNFTPSNEVVNSTTTTNDTQMSLSWFLGNGSVNFPLYTPTISRKTSVDPHNQRQSKKILPLNVDLDA